MISGLFFGFAFGMGGVGAAVLGKLADMSGIGFVYHVCSFLPLIGLLTAFLPDLRKVAIEPGRKWLPLKNRWVRAVQESGTHRRVERWCPISAAVSRCGSWSGFNNCTFAKRVSRFIFPWRRNLDCDDLMVIVIHQLLV